MIKDSDNADAERALKSVVARALKVAAVDNVQVMWAEDHMGEPALFVVIRLKAGHKRPSGAQSIDLVKAMQGALLKIGDERFPYLSFSAPEDEPAEDTRKIA